MSWVIEAVIIALLVSTAVGVIVGTAMADQEPEDER